MNWIIIIIVMNWIIIIIIIIGSTALMLGLDSFLLFLNPIHSRYDSLHGG
jgi:hypothetical protein